jgi:hypothetical protein
MSEREEFSFDKGQLGMNGFGFSIMGLGMMGLAFGTQRWEDDAPVIVLLIVLGVAMIVAGLIDLNKRRRTGVQVAVDREGIYIAERGPDPIPWTEVERLAYGVGGKGSTWVSLHLRPGSPTAARLGKTSLRVYDRLLTDGSPGLRQAIARLAPQVSRDW